MFSSVALHSDLVSHLAKVNWLINCACLLCEPAILLSSKGCTCFRAGALQSQSGGQSKRDQELVSLKLLKLEPKPVCPFICKMSFS